MVRTAAYREPVEVRLRVLHETDRAFLVTNGDGEGAPQVWLSKRLCKNVSMVEHDTGVYEIEMPEWLAQKEGFI